MERIPPPQLSPSSQYFQQLTHSLANKFKELQSEFATDLKSTIRETFQELQSEFARDFKSTVHETFQELQSEFARDDKSTFETVQKAVAKSVNTLCSSCCKSKSVNAKPSASRSLKLEFLGTLPDDIMTLDKVKCKDGWLRVVLQDNSGSMVEVEPESCGQIEIYPLDGDFDVEDRDDWTAKEFDKKVAEPRNGKGSLLKGTCKIPMKNGLAEVNDIAFTDNSKCVTKNGFFRIGARVIQVLPTGVEVKEAVSKAFKVKERRGKFYRRNKTLSLVDSPDRLKHIGKALVQKLADKNIRTMGDFLRRYDTDSEELKDILRLPDSKWSELVEDVESRVLPQMVRQCDDDVSRLGRMPVNPGNSMQQGGHNICSIYSNQTHQVTPARDELRFPSSTLGTSTAQHREAMAANMAESPRTTPILDPTVSMERGGQVNFSFPPEQTCQGQVGLTFPNALGHSAELENMIPDNVEPSAKMWESFWSSLPSDQPDRHQTTQLFPFQAFGLSDASLLAPSQEAGISNAQDQSQCENYPSTQAVQDHMRGLHTRLRHSSQEAGVSNPQDWPQRENGRTTQSQCQISSDRNGFIVVSQTSSINNTQDPQWNANVAPPHSSRPFNLGPDEGSSRKRPRS